MMILGKLKFILKEWIRIIFRTKMGKRVFNLIASEFKQECIDMLSKDYSLSARFPTFQTSNKVSGFEDLYFLFWCSQLNRGLIRMDLDEAAYLFKLVNSLKNPLCIEIGRFIGGSTFLIASAMREGGRLISLDLHVKMMLNEKGDIYDKELEIALNRFGLKEKVEIVVADSAAYPNKGLAVDFLFLDGDHTYEGARRDYEHWINVLKPSGHILFHDACDSDSYRFAHSGIKKLVGELSIEKKLGKVKEIGTLAHFIKEN
jgi:SAM-dependent methyltransferase